MFSTLILMFIWLGVLFSGAAVDAYEPTRRFFRIRFSIWGCGLTVCGALVGLDRTTYDLMHNNSLYRTAFVVGSLMAMLLGVIIGSRLRRQQLTA